MNSLTDKDIEALRLQTSDKRVMLVTGVTLAGMMLFFWAAILKVRLVLQYASLADIPLRDCIILLSSDIDISASYAGVQVKAQALASMATLYFGVVVIGAVMLLVSRVETARNRRILRYIEETKGVLNEGSNKASQRTTSSPAAC